MLAAGAATVARLWLYLLFLTWVSRLFFQWQSFALAVLLAALEFGMTLFADKPRDTFRSTPDAPKMCVQATCENDGLSY